MRQANDNRTRELPLEVEPARNVRVPEQDKRRSRGDRVTADAWRELATGELFFVRPGYDASRRRPVVMPMVDHRQVHR
jgi:hypothetical protein